MKTVFDSDEIDIEESEDGSLISKFFTPAQIKTLFHYACRVDIADNNDKAEAIKAILPATEFDELGTGTNRIGFLHNGMVVKLALDRRGLVDNYCEFKRSQELPEYLAKTYESNMLINITEYITVLSQQQFKEQASVIRSVLEDLSRGYLFDDIGYTLKNSMNWGYRDIPGSPELVILDYGYLYPLDGQEMERLLRCPKCYGQLQWNPSYTGFECTSKKCKYTAKPKEIRDRMSLDLENLETQMLADLNHSQAPDFINIESLVTDLKD